MPLPTTRTVWLLAAGVLLALAAISEPGLLRLLLALDLAVLAAAALDALLAPGPGSLRARRRLRQPLSAFAPNRVAVEVEPAGRAVLAEVADAPPATFDSRGHRARLEMPAGAAAVLAYEVVPRARGMVRFGDLHVRARGPFGLAARQWRVALSQEVAVYPDLRGLARAEGPRAPEPGAARARGHREGREFESLRPYAPGDDLRAVDWKATARRGVPVVREHEPERNQSVWLLLDCGRHLSARLPDGRVKLDHAVDAALAVARAAVKRGDRVGALLFGAEVRRVVPPGRGSRQLGPVAEALSRAEAAVEESDYAAAFDELTARQRRRALVLVFSDLADPDTSALLLSRAALLRRRHLLLLAAVADSAIADAARAVPDTEAEAYARLAAERILAERDLAARRLQAAGVEVASVPARDLTAAAVGGYLAAKASGRL
ncbi:MAG TPA: DUF58 domain-containing protein [Anaeromyxobacteraceae bacterium]|nr:DUF58 domain-containing protein [Anaeromyxobacteraceae bacterium]